MIEIFYLICLIEPLTKSNTPLSEAMSMRNIRIKVWNKSINFFLIAAFLNQGTLIK